MAESMTQVIARRTMIRTHEDGTTSEVEIRFGKPTFVPPTDPSEDGDYYCPIQLVGFDNDKIYVAYGADGVNALVLALVFAPSLLKMSAIANDLDYSQAPNFAFPVLPTSVSPTV